MACEAVPLAYRMTYGFLARMGFRKSEAIGDPETDAEPLRWRALDLERGVVRVARSKTEKPRPVPLDAGVWRRRGPGRVQPADGRCVPPRRHLRD